jgi:hypothetical protein
MSTISSQNPTTVVTIATPGPKGPPGPAAPAGDLSGSLQLTGSLSVSGSGTGSFVDFSNTQYVTGSFTGSFKGDGSGITGITASIANSSSFAVITGPNQFTGSQFVTGSIIPEAIDSGNGLHDLGSVTKPWRDLYITTSSLNFVKNAVVIASMNGEPGGVRIGNIFIGTGSISVVSGSGDNMTTISNVVEVTTNDSGSVEKVMEQYVTASGAASITGSLTVSGSDITVLGGTFVGDGSGLTGITASLPSGVISSSTQLDNLGYVESSITSSTIITSSVNLNVITFTKGDSSTFSITVDTGSGESLPSGVISSSAQVIESLPLGIISGSEQLPLGLISSSTQLDNLGYVESSITSSTIITSSANLNEITFTKGDSSTFTITIDTGSGEPLPNGVISSSTQVIESLPSGVISGSEQLPSGIISSSSQIENSGFINSSITSSMSVASASYAPTPTLQEVTNQGAITTNNITIDGNLNVNGTGSFGVIHTIYETSSIIYASGSTKFGDSLDDTHQFTGSISLSGSFLTDGMSFTGNIVSSSAQVIEFLPSGTISSSSQLPSGIISGSSQLPSGIISGSSQLPSGIISGSSQLTALGVSVASGGSTTFDNNVIVSGSSSNLEVQGDLHVTGSLTTSVQTVNPTFQPTGWTVILPVSTGNFFETTLANASINTIGMGIGNSEGQTVNVKTIQNATSPGTISWQSNIKFPDGFDSGSSTGTGEIDIWSFVTFDGATWYATGLKNFS